MFNFGDASTDLFGYGVSDSIDEDGDIITTAHDAAKAREEKEARSRERYQRGELSLDIYSMRDDLTRLGLRYVDYEEDAGR